MFINPGIDISTSDKLAFSIVEFFIKAFKNLF